jgi:hypothetical protein
MQNNPNKNAVFPELLKRLGVWPFNVGLFFLYNNVVTILVVMVTSALLARNAAMSQQLIAEKIQGASFIATLLTLGLTFLYRRTFYITYELTHDVQKEESTEDKSEEIDESQPDQKI